MIFGGRNMKKEELAYLYSIDYFKDILEIKKDIRNRSSFIIELSIPIIISLTSISFAISEDISCSQIILLLISLFFLIVGIVFFLLIYVPSSQKKYSVDQVIKEVSNLYDKAEYKLYLSDIEKENHKALTKIKDPVLKKEKETELNTEYSLFLDSIDYIFIAKIYSENSKLYEAMNKKFKVYFSLLAISLPISMILISVTLII